jgi:hypothetical protein
MHRGGDESLEQRVVEFLGDPIPLREPLITYYALND